MTNIELIEKERNEQINKHGRTILSDINNNHSYQLTVAACALCNPAVMPSTARCPDGWNITLWNRMINKSYQERLVIAGALIVAELDRLEYMFDNAKLEKLLADDME